ncbi:MAG: glycosyltransferase family 2 protein [Phascolarctobacterium sp.]|nr:glycosyltransferase family 2 protein [Phascolarctobacterium sp.]
MKPLFSIVVPVYNVEKYLQRCLDSIVNQTFKNFECILVNDGSTDGSTEIVNYYAKEYGFLKAIHQSNKGLSAARNKGIENCSGEYILFCDSDDFVEKEMLESCYKKFVRTIIRM